MRIILTFVLVFLLSITHAQNKGFKLTFGGAQPDNGYSAIQVYDSGYVAMGTTSTLGFTNGSSDVLLIKTDTAGAVKWKKHFGSAQLEIGRQIIQTTDTSLVMVGYTNNTNSNGYDVYLLKTDRWGNLLWEKKFGGTDWDFGYSVKETTDGGYIIAGGTYSFGQGNEDMYIIKTDKNGNLLWTKTYGGANDDVANVVKNTSDGGYVIAGETKSINDITGDAYLLKLNAAGDSLWSKYYGGAKEDLVNDITECANGDFALCGITYSFTNKEADAYLLRVQNNGTLIWSKNAEKDSVYDSYTSILELANGRLVAAGTAEGFGGGGRKDAVIIFYKSDGTRDGGTTHGTGEDDGFNSVATTFDKGFIMCGFTDTTSLGFNAPNLLLVKTDSTGILQGKKFLLTVNKNQNETSLMAFPNPASDIVTIVANDVINLKVIDITGKVIQEHISNTNRLELSVKDISPGIYFIQQYGQNNISTKKIIIQ